jgi:integrase/recombinase XerC
MSRTPRYALNKNKYLLEPEADRLEYLLKSHLSTDPRNSLLLLAALHTGARARELLNARFEDLNPYEETLFIHGIKGSNDREIPLYPWLFKELQKLKGASPSSRTKVHPHQIFPVSYQRLRQIWGLYRPVDKKFHSLRHTFAIRLFKKTKDLRLVQVALGHRNITNTMIYADYIYSQQELRRLIL